MKQFRNQKIIHSFKLKGLEITNILIFVMEYGFLELLLFYDWNL